MPISKRDASELVGFFLAPPRCVALLVTRAVIWASRLGSTRVGGEGAVFEKLAAMPEPDRALGTRLHALIKASAPGLSPRTWYGMPAYAKGDKVVCFFQGASKFKARYATLGFSDAARLDDGAMWPTAFALKQLGGEEEARISALVKRAAGVEVAG